VASAIRVRGGMHADGSRTSRQIALELLRVSLICHVTDDYRERAACMRLVRRLAVVFSDRPRSKLAWLVCGQTRQL